jgi:predicted GH43/DUF377 family glycosyl hydrolase
MGAYTFFGQPPFNITKVSSIPIMSKGFYSDTNYEKRVIFPGGFILSEPYIHLAYGKNDCEMWIATIHKERLLSILEPVQEFIDFDEVVKDMFDSKNWPD